MGVLCLAYKPRKKKKKNSPDYFKPLKTTMSANLDKSLDEIIGSNKKPIRRATRGGPKKVSKQINGNRRRGPAPTGPKRGAPIKAASLLDAAYSTKVNVEGLPRDIKQDAVKVCFFSPNELKEKKKKRCLLPEEKF